MNNLMLCGLSGSRWGFLIDLDYALDVDKERRSGAKPPLSPQNCEERMKRQMAATDDVEEDRGQRTVSYRVCN